MIDGIRDWWRRRTWLRAALYKWRAEVDEAPIAWSAEDVLRKWEAQAPPQAEKDVTDTI